MPSAAFGMLWPMSAPGEQRDPTQTPLVATPKREPQFVHARPLDEPVAGALTKQRKLAALMIAVVSDAISVFAELVPPLEWALDGATAFALFAVLGFRWPLLPVLVVEAVPGLAAFPTWVLVVGVVVGTSPTQPREDAS
jgi:hypothetical protein